MQGLFSLDRNSLSFIIVSDGFWVETVLSYSGTGKITEAFGV